MIHIPRAALQALLLISLFTGVAPAQEKAPKRTCRILFLEGPDTAPRTLHLFDGTRSQEVELPRLNFSPVYELPPGNLNLTLLPDPPAAPDQIPAGAPAAKLPETVVDFYLLLVSDPANKIAPVSMRIINTGTERLRSGQMLWFNLTGQHILGLIGSEKLSIKPQSTVILNAPANGAEDYPVKMAYRMKGVEQLYPIIETKWFHDPRGRSLAFVFAKPGNRTPRVQVFPDFRVRDSN